jgi:hypothetical protein
MIGFTPGEVALNRAPFAADLPDVCHLARYGRTDDNAGGYTEAWTPDADPTPCRVAAQLRAAEQQLGSGVALQMPFVVTLPVGTVVGSRDRVLWDDPTTATTRTLQVVGLGGRSRPLSFRVQAVEVETEAP